MHSVRNDPFSTRLEPAPQSGGFSMDDYWIWGSSVVVDDDSTYHMFSSRWSKEIPFTPGWTSNSHIVRATASTPEGPYEFEEEVIPPGGADDWDRMSHNPSIVRAGDTYLLYYYGCSYDGSRPSPNDLRTVSLTGSAVGVASAPSPAGPWTKHGPIIADETNAVSVVHDDDRVLTYVRDGNFEMSVYEADHWSDIDGYRLVEKDVLRPVEDHAVWQSAKDDRYHAVLKDMQRHHDHEGYTDSYAGFHATSVDGIKWTVSDPSEAYPHGTTGDRELVVEWDDGFTSTFANLERAQVLVEDGVATHLFFAVLEYREEDLAAVEQLTELPPHAQWPADTYNIVVPLTGGSS